MKVTQFSLLLIWSEGINFFDFMLDHSIKDPGDDEWIESRSLLAVNYVDGEWWVDVLFFHIIGRYTPLVESKNVISWADKMAERDSK